MIPFTDWKPNQAQIEWQKLLLEEMQDVATWAVPASASVFEINKPEKTFKLVTGNAADEMNRRIAVVLRILGYSEAGTPVNRVKDRF